MWFDMFVFFFFNDTATTEIYTLSLHDALPIYRGRLGGQAGAVLGQPGPGRYAGHAVAHGRTGLASGAGRCQPGLGGAGPAAADRREPGGRGAAGGAHAVTAHGAVGRGPAVGAGL